MKRSRCRNPHVDDIGFFDRDASSRGMAVDDAGPIVQTRSALVVFGGRVLGAGTERVVALYCGEVGELSAGDVADWVGEIAGAVKEGEVCDWGPRRRRRD